MNNMFFASRHDYLRIAVSILNDWQSDNCVGQYLKRIYNKRTPKNLSQQKNRSEPAYGNSKSYGGQFHLDYRGLQNRKVIGMSGFGGQSILIDTESSRIVVLHSVHYNYDHIGLLINPIKKGFVETNLNGDGEYDTFPPTFVKNDNKTTFFVTKYDRTGNGMRERFKCLSDYAVANGIIGLPSAQEIETLITSLKNNDYYMHKGKIVNGGITQESMVEHRKALIRLVNFEGSNEDYCAKPVFADWYLP